MIKLLMRPIQKIIDIRLIKEKTELENQRRRELQNLKYTARKIIEKTESYSNNHPIFSFVKHFVDLEFHNSVSTSLGTRDDHKVKDYSVGALVPHIPISNKWAYYSQPDNSYLYIDEFGRKHTRSEVINKCLYRNQNVEIKLGYDPVITRPWSADRLIHLLPNIGEGRPFGSWTQDNNHQAVLCLPLGITFVSSGNHSITTGILNNEGVINVDKIYDLSDMYSHLYTDGVNYFRTSDDSLYAPVDNFNFAVLFEIGRIMEKKKYEIGSIHFKNINTFSLKIEKRKANISS